jgi:hypothetical protein
MKPRGWKSFMRAWVSVPVNARRTAEGRSASSMTAWRTWAGVIAGRAATWAIPLIDDEAVDEWGTCGPSRFAATAMASSTRDCLTPMRMSPLMSLRRYFASSGDVRRRRDSTSATRAAVVRADEMEAKVSQMLVRVRESGPSAALRDDKVLLLRDDESPDGNDEVVVSTAVVRRSKAAEPRSPWRR